VASELGEGGQAARRVTVFVGVGGRKSTTEAHRIPQVDVGNCCRAVKAPRRFQLIPLRLEALARARQAHFYKEIPQKVVDDLRLLYHLPRLCLLRPCSCCGRLLKPTVAAWRQIRVADSHVETQDAPATNFSTLAVNAWSFRKAASRSSLASSSPSLQHGANQPSNMRHRP
jgi:hypothetical protein